MKVFAEKFLRARRIRQELYLQRRPKRSRQRLPRPAGLRGCPHEELQRSTRVAGARLYGRLQECLRLI